MQFNKNFMVISYHIQSFQCLLDFLLHKFDIPTFLLGCIFLPDRKLKYHVVIYHLKKFLIVWYFNLECI